MRIYFLVMMTVFMGLSFTLLEERYFQTEERPNILFIAIDDMNDWVGFLGTHPQVQTPHMDALAKAGVSFSNAHCPAPICGPSRTAILSGLWPTSSGIYSNAAHYRKQLPHLVSLPEHFRQNGYEVMGVGKIFHGGVAKMPEGAFDEYGGRGGSASPFTSADLSISAQTPFNHIVKQGKKFSLPLNGIPADRHWTKSHHFRLGRRRFARQAYFRILARPIGRLTSCSKNKTNLFSWLLALSDPINPCLIQNDFMTNTRSNRWFYPPLLKTT